MGNELVSPIMQKRSQKHLHSPPWGTSFISSSAVLNLPVERWFSKRPDILGTYPRKGSTRSEHGM